MKLKEEASYSPYSSQIPERNRGRDLDLTFKPVQNPHPKHLNREQIEFYNREGYLKPLDIFSTLEAERNRAYFDYLLASMRVYNDGRDTYAITGYQIRCQGIYEISTDARILDLVEDIVGPNIIMWGAAFFCKPAHDPKAVPWHQDASYWSLTPARTVSAWLAIDDVDVENSAMQFIPRSHNKGHLKWKEAQKPAVLNQEVENVEQYGQPVFDELQAGQISLHADMIVHGSEANRSARRRCGMVLRYCPPEVEPLNPSWAQQAILARGIDTHGWWKHCPKPAGDNLSPHNKPEPIGGG